MRRRILTAILSVTFVAIVLFGVPLAIVIERFVDEDATQRLERQAVSAARDVPHNFGSSDDPVELPAGSDQVRFALYDAAGDLVVGDGPPRADAAAQRALANRVTDAEQSGTRIVAVPVSADERVIGAIRAQQPTSASTARTWRYIALLGGLAVGVLAVGAVIADAVARRLARPVRHLSVAAVRLGTGDFTVDVPLSHVPEIDQAAQALAATAQRLDDLLQRARAFSADVSHQLRTPLAGLRASIETEREFPRPDRDDVLGESLVDIERLERTIDELLSVARNRSPSPRTTKTADLVAELQTAWNGPFARVGRRLTFVDVDAAVLVRGDQAVLRHALDVLLDNALTHGDGEVRVSLRVAHDALTISVSDEGSGFDVDPLAMTPSGEGEADAPLHGFGLPLARRLVESMDGRLTISRTGPHPSVDIVVRVAPSAPSAGVPG